MASMLEQKSTSRLLYLILLEAMDNEKKTYPETYEGAYHIGEKMRTALIGLSGSENFEPLPKLDKNKGGKNHVK